jgi:hypothetical protein
MSRPYCHCGVPMYEKSRGRQELRGYWAVFECKTIHCPKCGNGRCRNIIKEFVETH